MTRKQMTAVRGQMKTDNTKKPFKLKKKHVIPILVILLIIAVAVIAVIFFATRDTKQAASMEELMQKVRSKDVVVCRIDSVNDFFEDYYDAVAAGDEEALTALFDDPEKAKYSVDISEIISRYDSMKVYITPGMEPGEAAAFVYTEIYFSGVDVPAPSVESFYLLLDEKNNAVKIMTKQYSDESVNNFLTLVSMREPVRSLMSSTEDSLYGVLEENDELRNLYIIMSSMTGSGSGKE